MSSFQINSFNPVAGLLPANTEYIAIFDQDYNQMFKEAKFLDVRVRETSRAMEHPLESGAIITDHRIILPVEIDLVVLLNASDYFSLYAQIRENFFDSTLFIVQTRTGVYENQMITALPHAETAEIFDGVIIDLSFRQVLIVSSSSSYSPQNSSDSDTVNRGTQQGTSANDDQTEKATSGLLNVS